MIYVFVDSLRACQLDLGSFNVAVCRRQQSINKLVRVCNRDLVSLCVLGITPINMTMLRPAIGKFDVSH